MNRPTGSPPNVVRAALRANYERHTVYCLFGGDHELLYVGVSVRPLERLVQHEKTAWWPDVVGITLEHFADRDEAEERERWLILEGAPVFNRRGRVVEPPVAPTPEVAA